MDFCLVTVNLECVEGKTTKASNCPRGPAGQALEEHRESAHLWTPCLSAKHGKTKQCVNAQSRKASSCLSELSSTDSEEKFNLID